MEWGLFLPSSHLPKKSSYCLASQLAGLLSSFWHCCCPSQSGTVTWSGCLKVKFPASGNCFPSTFFMLPLLSGCSCNVPGCLCGNMVNRGQTLAHSVEFGSTFLRIILGWLVSKAVPLSQWSVVHSYPT